MSRQLNTSRSLFLDCKPQRLASWFNHNLSIRPSGSMLRYVHILRFMEKRLLRFASMFALFGLL